jgi:REP element-mobilizing transposase RayT
MAGTFTNRLYHIVFSTKNRAPLVSPGIRDDLYEYVGGIIRGEGGVLIEIGGMPDHVHLLTKFKPAKSVSEMLNRIKAKSSKWVHETKLAKQDFGWQDGYAAFSVSESQVPAVRLYLQGQEQHHRVQSYQDEVRALLERHGVEYDERYLWS